MTKISTLIKRIIYSLGLFILSAPFAFSEEAGPRQCNPFSVFLSDGLGDHFLLKDAYVIVADVCSDVAKSTWDTFATSLQGIMALGVGIYIAAYTLRNVGSFSNQNVGGYLSNEKTGIIPLVIKSAFIILLLSDQNFVYKYLIAPIVGAGIDVGKLVSGSTWSSALTNAGSTKAMFYEVIKQAQSFNDQIYQIVAMGRLMLCLAFLPTVFLDWFWVLIPLGAALYIFGWMLIISISFYLLDLLIRLGVACMVLPFAIACGISKLTAPYTKKTWDIFVNTAFNFIVLGVVITFTTKMIEKSLGGAIVYAGASALRTKFFGNESNPLTVADADAISQDIGVMTFVLVALCCMIAMKLFFSVETIANQLSSTSTIAKDKGLGAQAGKEMAQKATKAVKEPAKDMAKATGKEIKETLGNTKVGHKLGIS